jgi:hypothetical protein
MKPDPRPVILGRQLTPVPLQQAVAGPAAVVKRARTSAVTDDKYGDSRLSPLTALPLSVWQEHLTPLLSIKEAAGLRGVCKALRGVLEACPIEIEPEIRVENLEAALTCFPAIKELCLSADQPLEAAEESRMVELLRGHGGTLRFIEAEGKGAERLLAFAVRAGALPKLDFFSFSLEKPTHRQILSKGMLGLLEEVHVSLDEAKQAKAMEHLRCLPQLRVLRLVCDRKCQHFPLFIPPTLKTLILEIKKRVCLECLLRELPSMLQASGAKLDEIELCCAEELRADDGAALAQVVRACSPTLKALKLTEDDGLLGTAYIPGLLPGITSCCDTLEVLQCPWALFNALPFTCPTFPRLTELHLEGVIDENAPSTLRVWDIMSDGRLPALTSFYTRVFSESVLRRGGGWRERVRPVADAFEAVAATLTRLTLAGGCDTSVSDLSSTSCHDLGAAIGKLRRLRYLELDLFSNAQEYAAVGRGLAASGGCPELFELEVCGLEKNVNSLLLEPSLIVPSVRNLRIHGFCTNDEALLLCCGLVENGYQYRFEHGLSVHYGKDLSADTRACMRAILKCRSDKSR